MGQSDYLNQELFDRLKASGDLPLPDQDRYPIELLSKWAREGNQYRDEILIFIDEFYSCFYRDIEVPRHWQLFACILLLKVSNATVNHRTVRNSRISRSIGLSKPRSKQGRDFVIAMAVRHRIYHDIRRGAVKRACIRVAEVLQSPPSKGHSNYERVSWHAIRNIYYRADHDLLDSRLSRVVGLWGYLGYDKRLFED